MDLKQIEHSVGIYATWVKAHEKLLVIVIGALLAFHLYGSALSAWVEHDKRVATASNAQSTTLQDQLHTLQTTVAEQNAKIDQAMKQRATVTVIQKQKDDALQPTELSKRIQAQLGVGTVSVSSPLGDSLVFNLEAAHKVARDEEDFAKAIADVADLNTKLVSCQAINVKADKTLDAEKKAHHDDVDTLRAENHRQWLKGFKWGAITGFVGGLLALHKI